MIRPIGSTPKTGLTIAQADIRLSKDGGDPAQTHNAAGATHKEEGYYAVPLDATDTNTIGRLRVMVTVATALGVKDDYEVIPVTVYDAIISGSSDLGINVAQWNGHTVGEVVNGEPVVTLGATQAAYAPAKAGDKMDIINSPNTTGIGVIVQAIWDKLLSGILTAGSIGKHLKDNINAAISSRAAPGDAMLITPGTSTGKLDVANGVVNASLKADSKH